jgi:hypothetical protein
MLRRVAFVGPSHVHPIGRAVSTSIASRAVLRTIEKAATSGGTMRIPRSTAPSRLARSIHSARAARVLRAARGGLVLAALAFAAAGAGASAGGPPASRAVVLHAKFHAPGLPGDWTFDRPEIWSVTNGRLRARLPDEKQEKSLAYFGREHWKDYQLDLDVYGVRGVDKGFAVRNQGEEGIGIDLRGPGYDDVVMYRGYSQLGRAPVTNPNGRWHHVRVVVRGNRYQVFVNRRLRIDYVDPNNERPAGRLALAAYTGGVGECEVLFDNVVVRSLE